MAQIDIEKRTFAFAIEIIKLVNEFPKNTNGYVLGKQLVASGTSINSNIVHGRNGLNRKEFIYYYNNARKEAKETKNWLILSNQANLITFQRIQFLLDEIEEIIKILMTCVKTAKKYP